MPQASLLVHYPYTAVVGQASFKLALVLATIHPNIGGVLVSGPRGSAKSTLARALADVLPLNKYSKEPASFVTLPLGASDEMVTGTLDLQQVLNEKKVEFKPGILAKAHQGILYVDEVNLLNDALVDLLLDVAASGINCVERDGISHQHAAKFVLLGTMNPDEGELRPQLQDRFGLSLTLDNRYTLEERVEIVRRRECFDQNPDDFCQQYAEQQTLLRSRIQAAQSLLPLVQCSDALRLMIAERSEQANVDGLRADIVWFRAALAHAAWHERLHVGKQDIDAVENLVLAHRRQAPPSSPSAPPSSGPDNTSKGSSQAKPFSRPAETEKSTAANNASPNVDNNGVGSNNGDWGSMTPQIEMQQDTQKILALDFESLAAKAVVYEKRQNSNSKTLASKNKGQSAGGSYRTQGVSNSPNWFSSLLKNTGSWPPKHLVYQKKKGAQITLNFVLLDTSGSTLGQQLMAQAKGVVLQISEQAYLQREQLAILGFGNDQVADILPRVRAPKQIESRLNELRAGGGTPIREALLQAERYLSQLLRKIPKLIIKCYVITDGRTRQSLEGLSLPGECTVIDIEQASVKRGRAKSIAHILGAQYLSLAQLQSSDSIAARA